MKYKIIKIFLIFIYMILIISIVSRKYHFLKVLNPFLLITLVALCFLYIGALILFFDVIFNLIINGSIKTVKKKIFFGLFYVIIIIILLKLDVILINQIMEYPIAISESTNILDYNNLEYDFPNKLKIDDSLFINDYYYAFSQGVLFDAGLNFNAELYLDIIFSKNEYNNIKKEYIEKINNDSQYKHTTNFYFIDSSDEFVLNSNGCGLYYLHNHYNQPLFFIIFYDDSNRVIYNYVRGNKSPYYYKQLIVNKSNYYECYSEE